MSGGTPRIFERANSLEVSTSVFSGIGEPAGAAIPTGDEYLATPSSPGSPSRGPSLDLDMMIQQGHHLAENQAAQELMYRLNHARQTFDFVTKQVRSNQSLARCQMDIWSALDMLNGLREYEAVLTGDENLDPDMSLVDHAFQSAALSRQAFPEEEWMPLVGLVHGLGKLLAHEKFGSQQQWAICGETFPVGCRFSSAIVHANYFSANPDRRKKQFSTALGIYQPNCGFRSVFMSWSGAEYLYMLLALNKTQLPREALWLLRYQKFRAVTRPGRPYHELMCDFDVAMLPKLEKFVDLIQYKRRDIVFDRDELKQHCDGLIKKYFPSPVLCW